MDLALNNRQRLIYHKPKQLSNQPDVDEYFSKLTVFVSLTDTTTFLQF